MDNFRRQVIFTIFAKHFFFISKFLQYIIAVRTWRSLDLNMKILARLCYDVSVLPNKDRWIILGRLLIFLMPNNFMSKSRGTLFAVHLMYPIIIKVFRIYIKNAAVFQFVCKSEKEDKWIILDRLFIFLLLNDFFHV